MTEEELRKALDGLYDTGSHDSGIHDEALRQRCIAAIQAWQIGSDFTCKKLARNIERWFH